MYAEIFTGSVMVAGKPATFVVGITVLSVSRTNVAARTDYKKPTLKNPTKLYWHIVWTLLSTNNKTRPLFVVEKCRKSIRLL